MSWISGIICPRREAPSTAPADRPATARKVDGTGREGAGRTSNWLRLVVFFTAVPGASGSECPELYDCATAGRYLDHDVSSQDIWDAACAQSSVNWETAAGILGCDMATLPRALVAGIEDDSHNLRSSQGCVETAAVNKLCGGLAPEVVHQVRVWNNNRDVEPGPLALFLHGNFSDLREAIDSLFLAKGVECHQMRSRQAAFGQALNDTLHALNVSSVDLVAFTPDGTDTETVLDAEGCPVSGRAWSLLTHLQNTLLREQLEIAVAQRDSAVVDVDECGDALDDARSELAKCTGGQKRAVDMATAPASIGHQDL